MAKSTLPVNYQDDILNSAMSGKRRFRMINNSDGTVSFEDVTTYDQVGSNFGAGQINATNAAVNAAPDASKIIDDMDAIRALTQEGYMAGALALKQVDDSLVNENSESFNFGYLNGVRGFYTNPSRADDCFIPFKSGLKIETFTGFTGDDNQHTFKLKDTPTDIIIFTTDWRKTYQSTPYDFWREGFIYKSGEEDNLTNVSGNTLTFMSNHAKTVTVLYL